MESYKTMYRLGLFVALAAAFILLWGIGAVGVVGVEGDSFDLLYFVVLLIGIIGAASARFRPTGMARTLVVMACALGVIAVTALAAGKHEAVHSSVLEVLGLNAFFGGLFLGAAWLFRRAAQLCAPS